jgi:hypothetical protein
VETASVLVLIGKRLELIDPVLTCIKTHFPLLTPFLVQLTAKACAPPAVVSVVVSRHCQGLNLRVSSRRRGC